MRRPSRPASALGTATPRHPRRGEFRGEPDHGPDGSSDARRRLRVSGACPAAGEQQGQPGGNHNQGEHPEQQRVVGLKINGTELAGVELEQPEGIDAALQQQAVEGATDRRQQQRCGGQGIHNPLF